LIVVRQVSAYLQAAGTCSMSDAATSCLTLQLALAIAAACAVLLAGTVLLWAHYGTTVFFEKIRAGFSACLG
jgi:hypothetical protein